MPALRRFSGQVLMVVGITGTTLLMAVPSHANLIIQVNEAGCATDVVDETPQPDCSEHQTACRNRGNQVVWLRADRSDDFSITFGDPSLFDNWGSGQCQNPPGNDRAIRCRISDAAQDDRYKYDVGTTGCDPLDPYIRVR